MHSTIKERLDKLEAYLGTLQIGPITRETLMGAVRDIAIEQDKITRHACADAMLELPYDMQHTDARDACLKVRTIS